MPNLGLKTRSMESRAYIVTGPTCGIGRRTALDVAKHGTVVLVGRDRGKLDAVQNEINKKAGMLFPLYATCPISQACNERLLKM